MPINIDTNADTDITAQTNTNHVDMNTHVMLTLRLYYSVLPPKQGPNDFMKAILSLFLPRFGRRRPWPGVVLRSIYYTANV